MANNQDKGSLDSSDHDPEIGEPSDVKESSPAKSLDDIVGSEDSGDSNEENVDPPDPENGDPSDVDQPAPEEAVDLTDPLGSRELEDNDEEGPDGPVDLPVGNFSEPVETKAVDQIKEETATRIAQSIIYIFAAAILLSFLLQAWIIYLALWYPNIVKDSIIPSMGGSLLEILKLVGTIFSPLLAFILGYYYSASLKEKGKG